MRYDLLVNYAKTHKNIFKHITTNDETYIWQRFADDILPIFSVMIKKIFQITLFIGPN